MVFVWMEKKYITRAYIVFLRETERERLSLISHFKSIENWWWWWCVDSFFLRNKLFFLILEWMTWQGIITFFDQFVKRVFLLLLLLLLNYLFINLSWKKNSIDPGYYCACVCVWINQSINQFVYWLGVMINFSLLYPFGFFFAFLY